MERTAWKWFGLGIAGVLIVNLMNIVSSLSFGTQDLLSLVAFMAAFYSCIVLFSARVCYLREKKMARVIPKPSPIIPKGDKTIIYSKDQYSTSGEPAITLPTGEIRCTECGFTNPPYSKECKNCGQTF